MTVITPIKKKINSESGVTLVELLAAIAILSIVVTSFLAFFIQSANTNRQTNEVNEATFLAQEEMERVTSYSTGDYSKQEVIDSFFTGGDVRITTQNGYQVRTKLFAPEDEDESKLYKVIVEVTEGGIGRAKMETRLPFEKDAGE